MTAAERERTIVAGAIDAVAKVGFNISVRDLAKHLDVPHSVLFRHFPNKAALLKRIYDEVFAARLRPEWSLLLTDTSTPVADRLLAFYRAYTAAIFDETWIRIFMHAGLGSPTLNKVYLETIETSFLVPICSAIKAELRPGDNQDVTTAELERVWGLHGRIFYIGVRRYVYGRALPELLDATLVDAIKAFLDAEKASAKLSYPKPEPAREGYSGCVVSPPKKKRLRPEERRELIVEGAISFFAERGIGGHLRDLARNLDIGHPLLFNYFASKNDLLDTVYEAVFERPWSRMNTTGLNDAETPLEERLTRFYKQYLAVVDRDAWIRIFISAGLSNAPLCSRYLDQIESNVIDVVAAALVDRTRGLNRVQAQERAWGLHGQIVFRAIRNRIYRDPPNSPALQSIEDAIRCFLARFDEAGTH